jgi:hypothetical protein
MANWTYGIILPAGERYESDQFPCDDGNHVFSLPGAKGDGATMLCYGNCRAGALTSE